MLPPPPSRYHWGECHVCGKLSAVLNSDEEPASLRGVCAKLGCQNAAVDAPISAYVAALPQPPTDLRMANGVTLMAIRSTALSVDALRTFLANIPGHAVLLIEGEPLFSARYNPVGQFVGLYRSDTEE